MISSQAQTLPHPNRMKLLLIWVTSSWKRFRGGWTIYSRDPFAVVGLVLLIIFTLMAFIHPFLLQTVWSKGVYDPVVGYDLSIYAHPSPPSAKHLLGTDTLGRDVLSVLLAATRPTFTMAMIAAITTAIIGTLAGALSAFFGGIIEAILTHLGDIALMTPAPLVMVVIGFMLDISPLKFGLLYGIISGIGGVAIVMRAFALTVVNKSFIEAARVAGGGYAHIILKHLVPHMLPLASVNMMLTVTGAIFANGFIAFLGLSRAQLNWGSMIYDSFTYQSINGQITWNVLIPSSLAISLFSASFYLIARGLHNVAEPRLAERSVLRAKRQKVKQPHKQLLTPQPSAEKPVTPTLAAAPGVDIPTVQQETIPTETINVTLLLARLRQNPSAGSGQPQETETLQGLLASMTTVLKDHDAAVKRLNQNTLLAVFGSRKEDASPQINALLAIHAGLSLMEFNATSNKQLAAKGLPSTRLGIGIAAGQASYEIRGQTKVLASGGCSKIYKTTQHLAYFTTFMPAGGLLINQETYANLAEAKNQFEFGHNGPAELAGENKPAMVYQVTGRKTHVFS